jgi:alpha-glucosidase
VKYILPLERLMSYYGRDLQGLHLPFNFSLLTAPWHARSIAKLIDEYEAALPAGGWPNWVLGNHDRPRIATRVGREQAPVAAVLLFALRGTPTIYYGEELGMEQVFIAPHQVRDPFELNVPGQGLGRDPCRTPMQWDTTHAAGFSTTEPWLPLCPLYRSRNVATLRQEAQSIYNLYRKLIILRRRRSSLTSGTYHAVAATGDLLIFVRQHDRERLLIALNFSDLPAQASFRDFFAGHLVLSSRGDRDGESIHGAIDLRANEAIIVELAPDSVLPP